MQCLSVSLNLIQQCHISAGIKYEVSVCLLKPYTTTIHQCKLEKYAVSVSLNLIQQFHISGGGKICSVCLSP